MFNFNGDFIKYTLILFNASVFLWEFHLILRQILTIVRSRIPQQFRDDLTTDIIKKSRRYTLNKIKLWMLENIQRITIVVWILHQNVLIYFWEYLMMYTSSYLKLNIIAAYVFFTAPWIVSLPFRIYDSLFCQNNAEFNLRHFCELTRSSIKDIISAHAYYVVMFVVLLIIMAISMNTGLDYYCLFVFCMLVTFAQVSMDTLYPSILASWFNKYSPLEDGLLKTQVQKLYSQCGVECLPIYVRYRSLESCTDLAYIDRSYHKKLVLNEQLLAYDNNLILSVIAHEIGHLKLSHREKMRDSNFIISFITLVFYLYMIRFPQFYLALGFWWMKPEIVASFALYHFVKVPLFGFINYFYMYRIIWKHEIEADNFVVEQKRGEDLREALLKLWQCSPRFPVMNKLYRNWFCNDVPLVERLHNIDKKMRKCS